MGQKLSEIIKDLLSRKNPDGSRQWTQMTLAAKLGTNQSGISQMLTGRQWDDHFEVFRKLVSDVEPMAVHEDPLSSRAITHYLLVHRDKLPPDERREYWEMVRNAAEEGLDTADQTEGIRNIRTAKPGTARRGKKKK